MDITVIEAACMSAAVMVTSWMSRDGCHSGREVNLPTHCELTLLKGSRKHTHRRSGLATLPSVGAIP